MLGTIQHNLKNPRPPVIFNKLYPIIRDSGKNAFWAFYEPHGGIFTHP
jgi:hypothetical protein